LAKLGEKLFLRKLMIDDFFNFNLDKVCQKLLLKNAIKFESNYVLPHPNLQLAIQKSKNLAFPVFRLQFDQTWAKIASNYLLPLAPSIFSYPGKRKFLNFSKTLILIFLKLQFGQSLEKIVS